MEPSSTYSTGPEIRGTHQLVKLTILKSLRINLNVLLCSLLHHSRLQCVSVSVQMLFLSSWTDP